MLRDLTIKNYRCFKEFHIDDLARVNLLVGSNNTGKTSLLEAIYLLVNQNRPESLVRLLENRGEISIHDPSHQNWNYQISNLFYGHTISGISIYSSNDRYQSIRMQIGPELESEGVKYINNLYTYPILFMAEVATSQGTKLEPIWGQRVLENGIADLGDQVSLSELSDRIQDKYTLRTRTSCILIPTDNLYSINLNKWWDVITLTPKEEKVVEAMKIIEPNTERINFTTGEINNHKILLKLRGESHPLPLSSMGSGMRRLLMLAMASVRVENGVLLVDEIEIGLHYEAQTDMWRLILETAQELNVQVFATTHSWDWICAFQEALEQFEDNSIGKLFRLSRRDDKIKPVAYTGDDLDIAVRQSIEVR